MHEQISQGMVTTGKIQPKGNKSVDTLGINLLLFRLMGK